MSILYRPTLEESFVRDHLNEQGRKSLLFWWILMPVGTAPFVFAFGFFVPSSQIPSSLVESLAVWLSAIGLIHLFTFTVQGYHWWIYSLLLFVPERVPPQPLYMALCIFRLVINATICCFAILLMCFGASWLFVSTLFFSFAVTQWFSIPSGIDFRKFVAFYQKRGWWT